MGKIVCKDKLKLLISFLLLIFSMTAADCYSATRDIKLFDTGYGYYLSYQPEKAAEEFRTFLKEFPLSSAKDAAMYWLGMSLVQLKEFQEAGKIFSDLKQQFPESPFSHYADKGLEAIGTAEHPPLKAGKAQEVTSKQDEKVERRGEGEEKVTRSPEKQKIGLKEEKKKNEELTAQVKETEKDKKRAEEIQAKVEAKVRELEQEEKKADEDKEKKEPILEEEEKKTKELPDMIKELEEEKKKTEVVLARLKMIGGRA